MSEPGIEPAGTAAQPPAAAAGSMARARSACTLGIYVNPSDAVVAAMLAEQDPGRRQR